MQRRSITRKSEKRGEKCAQRIRPQERIRRRNILLTGHSDIPLSVHRKFTTKTLTKSHVCGIINSVE